MANTPWAHWHLQPKKSGIIQAEEEGGLSGSDREGIGEMVSQRYKVQVTQENRVKDMVHNMMTIANSNVAH